MRRVRSSVFVLPALLSIATVVMAIACSPSSSEGTYDGPRTTTCSVGPPYDVQSYPPARAASSSANVGACVPRCGGEEMYPGLSGPIYAIAALPSGACPNDGELCTMTAAVVRSCQGQTRGCDVSLFECACESGSWRCYVTSQGGGVCGPCAEGDAAGPPDASDDG